MKKKQNSKKNCPLHSENSLDGRTIREHGFLFCDDRQCHSNECINLAFNISPLSLLKMRLIPNRELNGEEIAGIMASSMN
jgi:hypothetical protein